MQEKLKRDMVYWQKSYCYWKKDS